MVSQHGHPTHSAVVVLRVLLIVAVVGAVGFGACYGLWP